MTTSAKGKSSVVSIEGLLGQQGEVFKRLLKESLQEVLEAEMTEVAGAGSGQRTAERSGNRSGYYSRSLVTRIGKLELRVPRDRDGRSSTELFECYQRSEKALVSAVGEMYVQGVSTRKVKAVTEELCGHAFSASTISQINEGLAGALARVANRPLQEAYPYLILDARYEKVRIDGVIRSQAVLIAIGINLEGRRQVLAVELANCESATSWKEFLTRLKARGLAAVERNCETHCLSLTPIPITNSYFHNHVIPLNKAEGFIAKLAVVILFPLWSFWIAWSKKINLIIAFGSLYAFLQGFSKWIMRRPMVTFIRGSSYFGMTIQNSPQYVLYLNKMVEYLGLLFSDRIITNNIAARNEILKTLGKRKNIDIQILYNNIPPMNIREPEDISQDETKIWHS